MTNNAEDNAELKKILQETLDTITELARKQRKPGQKYILYVDDNFNYMDEGQRYTKGEYDTEEEALQAARQIIDQFLEKAYRPGSTPESLYQSYTQFGEDPYIPGVAFSAWDYARRRCAELCARP